MNQVKELLHLLHVNTSWSLRPASLVLRDLVDVVADGRVVLFHVKPLGIPPFQGSVQWYADIIIGHSVLELQIYAADHLGATAAFLL